MAILNTMFSWIGIVFLVGSISLYIRENKRSLPTKEEREFLINCNAISPDCKDKKVLREATRQLRMCNQVLSELELTGEEILSLNKQAQERKALKVKEHQKQPGFNVKADKK